MEMVLIPTNTIGVSNRLDHLIGIQNLQETIQTGSLGKKLMQEQVGLAKVIRGSIVVLIRQVGTLKSDLTKTIMSPF